MLNHAAKAIARTDKHAAEMSQVFGFSEPRDQKSINSLIEGAGMRYAVSMLKRLGVKPGEVNVPAAVTLTHRHVMQLLQATVMDMPTSTQQRLTLEVQETREGVRRTVARQMAKGVSETVYQQIAADWPDDIVLPEEMLRDMLGLAKAPKVPGAILADPAMEQARRQDRYMMMHFCDLLDGRMVRDDPELCSEYINQLTGTMLRDTVMTVAAELQPQQPLSEDMVGALAMAYGATLMTGTYMAKQYDTSVDATEKLAAVMQLTQGNLPRLAGLDHMTRLHFTTAFAERALLDTVDVDNSHNQMMQAAMLAMGLDPNLQDDTPQPPGSPPPPPRGDTNPKRKLN